MATVTADDGACVNTDLIESGHAAVFALGKGIALANKCDEGGPARDAALRLPAAWFIRGSPLSQPPPIDDECAALNRSAGAVHQRRLHHMHRVWPSPGSGRAASLRSHSAVLRASALLSIELCTLKLTASER